MSASPPIIELSDVVVTGGEKRILQIERLEIARGERIALIGASGSGKTTLLRLLKGFVVPCAGEVRVLGRRLPVVARQAARRHHQKIGMIHQHFDLIPRENVWRNVLHGRLGECPLWRSLLGLYSARDHEICLEAVREVQMDDKLGRQARGLSGGEQQRVAIARALAQEPEILLADEPVSSLDPGLARSVLELLMAVCDQHALTLLMSLHLPELARRYGRRCIALREGRIVWDGPPEALTPERLEEVYRVDRPGVRDVERQTWAAPDLGWRVGPLEQPLPGA